MKLIIFALFLMISFHCRNSTDRKNKTVAYSKVEIYCWCFLDTAAIENIDGTTSMQTRNCTTIIPVKPLELIESDHLFYLSSNKDTVERLRRVIFDQKKNSSIVDKDVDARFVIVLKMERTKDDIIACSQRGQWVVNGKYLFDYSFNLIDSIRKLLNVTKIDCKSD